MSTNNWFKDAYSPFLAVEADYFRIPRDNWERVLLRIRQMGANAVSTRVMWGWHEAQEGQFDFNGQSLPERDLLGFIRLAREMGFTMLLKPGPFIDAETLGGGIPAWLLAKIPEAHARRHDGQLWRHSESNQPRLSYLHPLAFEHAQKWLEAFSSACLEMQWPQGALVALQIDHETPGDGFNVWDQAEDGFDTHFRGDYNSFYTQTLWPQWLEMRHVSLEKLNAAYGVQVPDFQSLPFPAKWAEPGSIGEIRLWMDAARFTDWTYAQAQRQYRDVLVKSGWKIPLLNNLLSTPWQASGQFANMGALAAVSDWTVQDVAPGAVQNPIAEDLSGAIGFEELVQYAFWRSKLIRNYHPEMPGLVGAIRSNNDFLLQAMFAGDVQGGDITAGVQSSPEPVGVGVYPFWAMDAPIRADGSIHRRLWNARALFTYLQASELAFSTSHMPADILLGYSHVPELAGQWYAAPDYLEPLNDQAKSERTAKNLAANNLASESLAAKDLAAKDLAKLLQGGESGKNSLSLAKELVTREIDFDVIDIDFAQPEQLDPAKILILPASGILARRTQRRLADFVLAGGQIVWVGGDLPLLDETLNNCDTLYLSAQETKRVWQIAEFGKDFSERLVQMGYLPRYAWSDMAEAVDVTVRHGPQDTVFVNVLNRTANTYEGNLSYVDLNRKIQTIKVRLAGPHTSFITLRARHLQSALIHARDGAYVQVDGERIEVDRGQVAIARSGSALMITSADPVKVHATNPGGWGNPSSWQMATNGQVKPSSAVQVDGVNLTVYYPVESAGLDTLLLLINPSRQPVEPDLRDLFDTHQVYCCKVVNNALVQARSLAEQMQNNEETLAGHLPLQRLAANLPEVIDELESFANGIIPDSSKPELVEAYTERMAQFMNGLHAPVTRLVESLCNVRVILAAGPLPKDITWIERSLAKILETLHMLE